MLIFKQQMCDPHYVIADVNQTYQPHAITNNATIDNAMMFIKCQS